MVEFVERDKWAPAIGRVIIAFGDIELTTQHCIREWGGALLHKYLEKAKFAIRAALAKELAATQDASDVAKAAFCRSIERAEKLAQKRNLIAHNPVSLVLLLDSAEAPVIEAVAHHGSDQRLTYDELLEVADACEICALELRSAYNMYAVEKMDFESLKRFPGL